MSEHTDANKRISSKLDIPYPDFAQLPEEVKQKYDRLPTVVNTFRMLGYSSGTFVEIIDLTNAIFKKLTLSKWTAETALAVLLKDLKASYNEGLQHNISLPFNALSSTQLFNAMGKEKPDAR